MAELACRKPKWRTCMKLSGKTCWRNLRRNSMASRVVVRGAHCPLYGRCGDRTVREADEALVGDSDPANIGGEEVKAECPW